MHDFKKFKQAIWEVRKKYKRPRLTKKQLKEAYDLYIQAGENKAKFQELMKGMFNIPTPGERVRGSK